MTNALWDNYVIVTTHRDDWPNFGWSEDCEDYICALADEKEEWTVYEDYLYFWNYDNGFWEGNQWWECDGYASKIIMP